MKSQRTLAGVFIVAILGGAVGIDGLAHAQPYAIAAKGMVRLNGSGMTVDSFDSSDPEFSTDGQYDPAKKKSDATILSDNYLPNGISVGNASIAGHLILGFGGVATLGPAGTVGDFDWISSHVGIEPGWITSGADVEFAAVHLPYNSGLIPAPGSLILPSLHTNSFATNSATAPDPPPAGLVTNVTTIVMSSLTDPIPAGLTTNSVTATTAILPTPPPDAVTTNTAQTTTVGYPVAGTYTGVVQTNTVTTSANTYPGPGTYVGDVSTNTVLTTASVYPFPGSYLGDVTTNFSTVTNDTYPDDGTYLPPVTTNTVVMTTSSYPVAGTFLGTVTTNFNGGAHRVISYSYNRITSYSYPVLSGYSYQAISGYSYAKIKNYTYRLIVSYTYQTETYSYRYTNYLWTVSWVSTNSVTNFYDHILYSGDYYATSLTGQTIVLGNARLVLPNGLNMGTGDSFVVSPTGSIALYVASVINISPKSVDNQTRRARNFIVFGDQSVFVASMAGNGTFIGSIIAPYTGFSINSGGSFTLSFSGALVANSVTINGSHFSFHYDEDLSSAMVVFPSTFDSQPQSCSVVAGQDVSFSASASGGEPLQYQWMKWIDPFPPMPIPGETNTTLTLTGVTADDAADYFVVVQNSGDQSAESYPAELTVNYHPSVLPPPASQSGLIGSNVTFRIYASGTFPPWNPMSYQWLVNDVAIPGATLAFLSVSNLSANDAGSYSVVVTNLAGSITSTPTTLTLYSTAAASLDSASPGVVGGSFQFNITGVPGFRYVISATTNFVDWQPIATNFSPFTFIDTNVCAFPQRFYRADYYP